MDMPTNGEREKPEPNEGMVFSTIMVDQVRRAAVRVEHPAEMSRADVLAAVKDQSMDLAPRVSWWDADTTTKITGIGYKVDSADDEYQEPFKVVV